MGCCDDPTQAPKINRTDVARIQTQYGNLLRDLLTGDPEKLMLKQLQESNQYLTELAALNAHYESVRKQAILLLTKESISLLQRIMKKEPTSEIGLLAKQRIDDLEND